MGQVSVLQDRGFKVALVTDGRMSGASGKVPAAIHVSPEATNGGAIGKIRDGDMIRLDAERGILEVRVEADELALRETTARDLAEDRWGSGRELFAGFRDLVSGAESGATTFKLEEHLDRSDTCCRYRRH